MSVALPPHVFLPLHDEVREAAILSDTLLNKTWRPVYELADFGPFTLCLSLKDPEAAKIAAKKVADFRKTRKKLGAISKEHFKASTKALENHYRFLSVHYDDYIPSDFFDVLDDVRYTQLQFLPVSPTIVSAMQSFVDVYSSLEIIRVICSHFLSKKSTESIEPEVVFFHSSLLKFSQLVNLYKLDVPPVTITVRGEAKKLSVLVNGSIVDLAPKEIRGVAALAKLEYNRWFALNDFCNIAFLGDTYEPRKQFDAALSALKKFPPFGWDADEGIRRIGGAVIKSEVDTAVLDSYLRQKKAT